jgi:hypothetical protein
MYDFIGDIHGHADELVELLHALGYRPDGGVYAHPHRRVVFLGDYIDRGPKIPQTLAIVRGMVERGTALAILGNHEFNALCYATADPARPGEFLRRHTAKNAHQHRATLDQLDPAELADYVAWFRTLPVWLDLGQVRAVHACWDEQAMALVSHGLGRNGGMTPAFLAAASDPGDELYAATEILLKGKEVPLPAGVSFLDPDGHERTSMRTRWYRPADGTRYREYAFYSFPVDVDHHLPAEVVAAARPYPADAPPVFVGHYWLTGKHPELLAPNVACLDYSVAKGGFLCAYRWDGEQTLDPARLLTARVAISNPPTGPRP